VVREVVIEAVGRGTLGEELGEEGGAGVDDESGAVVGEALVGNHATLVGLMELY
jgi:hypothetical protein